MPSQWVANHKINTFCRPKWRCGLEHTRKHLSGLWLGRSKFSKTTSFSPEERNWPAIVIPCMHVDVPVCVESRASHKNAHATLKILKLLTAHQPRFFCLYRLTLINCWSQVERCKIEAYVYHPFIVVVEWKREWFTYSLRLHTCFYSIQFCISAGLLAVV